MQRESRLLGLCERTWNPQHNTWSHTCDDGLFLLFSSLFLSLAIGLIALCVGWAVAEIHKAKRSSGIDVDGIIKDARKRAFWKGHDDYRG